MRVLLNLTSQYRTRHGGVARFALRLAEELAARGRHDYLLLSEFRRTDLPDALQASGLALIERARPPILFADVLASPWTMPGLCRRHGVDVVLNLDPFGALAGGAARMTVVHDLYFRSLAQRFSRRARLTNEVILRRMIGSSQAVVAVSEATRRELEAAYPAARGKLTTILSDSPLRAGGDSVPEPGLGRYVLAVGNATSNKNLAALAGAMARLAPAFPDVAIVHVGDDPDDCIATALKAAGAAVPLHRRRGVDDAALAGLYAGAQCLCVPSLTEGFCLPVLEAQRLGCPVLCSARGALPEVAGEGAILFDPADVDDLAGALAAVLGSPARRAELAARGHANARRFSWARTARDYEALIEAVAGDGR